MTFRPILAALAAFFLSTASVHAQGSTAGAIGGSTLSAFLLSIIGFINTLLVPLVFAIAFIVFIWGVFQYFIAGGADEEKRETGKSLMLWGIIGFFVMASVWGLVNIVRGSFSLTNTAGSLPDAPATNN